MKTQFFAFAFVFAISAAEALPLYPAQPNVIVSVAGGCGLGVHRGPFDGCYPIYGYYADYDRGYCNNYYTGFVSRGVCSGRGTHLAGNFYGTCWVAC